MPSALTAALSRPLSSRTGIASPRLPSHVHARRSALLAAPLALSLALVGVVGTASPAQAAVPMSAVVLADVPQVASTVPTTVGSPCSAGNLPAVCGDPTSISYGNGVAKRLVSFTAGGLEYQTLPVALGETSTEVFRVDNANVTGQRENIFLARATVTTPYNQILNSDAGTQTMAEVFSSTVITSGSDNTFVNAGALNQNNVERISFLRTSPLTSSSPDRVGLTLLERGGNDTVKVAAVLAVDGSGAPTSWGPLTSIPTSAWGPVIANVPSTVFRKDPVDTTYRPTDRTGAQALSGMYISFAELGVTAGTPVFGVSLLPSDATTAAVTPATAITTSPESGGNGIDLIGGVFVSAVPPVAVDDSSTGLQGAAQTLQIVATPGDSLFPVDFSKTTLLAPTGGSVDASGTVVSVPGVGTYTLDRDTNTVVFQPVPTFVGAAPVVPYRVVDSQGASDVATLSPVVTPVAQPDTTTGPQGAVQTIDVGANDTVPGFTPDRSTVTLVDPTGAPVATVAIPGQGTYSLDGDSGNLLFTPESGFVGTASPAPYQVRDAAGTTVQSTYTATVTPAVPTASPDTSSGVQGAPQSIDPLANDTPGTPAVPLDPATLTLLDGAGAPAASVTVAGGVYTVASGRLVFTPDADFVGTAPPVTYRVADVNGATTTSTYTPTVTPTPTEVAVITETGTVGSPVTVDPADVVPGLVPATVRLLDAAGGPVTTLTRPGEGVWSVTVTTGDVTFTPEAGFRGQPSDVRFVAALADGTPVTGLLRVRYAAVAAAAPLAATGADSGAAIGGGIALLLGGMLLLGAARRRRGIGIRA
ncbi:MAG: hypothetical protein RI885_2031 [Actinomycetota bacterium]|jgi:CshA-type fibril repeat protein